MSAMIGSFRMGGHKENAVLNLKRILVSSCLLIFLIGLVTGILGYAKTAPAANLAYIYNTDMATANDFANFLNGRGHTTTLILASNVLTTDFSGYDLIIIGSDTAADEGHQYCAWYPIGPDCSYAVHVDSSGKPIIGLYEGGSIFFDSIGQAVGSTGLAIGWLESGYYGTAPSTNGGGTYVVNPLHQIFTSPINISIPNPPYLSLYSSSINVGVYLPTPPYNNITLFGKQWDTPYWYPLVQEGSRYFLWGFAGAPSAMTGVGKDLFSNIVAYMTPGLIDPTKWADLEFITRIEGGALRSAARSSFNNPTIGNNLTFIDPNNVTSIKADVTVTDLIYNGDFPRARIHGFFYDDTSGHVRAEVAIGDFGSGLSATYSVGSCLDFNCTGPSYTSFKFATLGTVNLGETHTLSISWDGTQFAFKLDTNPLVPYTPPLSGAKTSPIPFKAIGTGVTGGGLGGFVSALFDNVYIGGTTLTLHDNFDSSTLINSTKWKHYTEELNQALEIVREQVSDGVYGMALRGYGSFVNNGLNLMNGQNFKELQADLTVEQFINTPPPNAAGPQAELWGSYYNDGTSGIGATGDIRALAGIRHNGTQPIAFYTIVKCTQPDCNIYTNNPTTDEFQRLYYYEDPLTIGQNLVGKSHRVSISYNPSLNKFIFGFDGRAIMPAASDFIQPLPSNTCPACGPPKVVRKGVLTRVASGPSGEGYVSAQFANIATVADVDGDGVPDSIDNCPAVYNPIVAQWVDINKQLHTNSQPDFDLDGVGDACDLCPKVPNDGGPCPSTGPNAVGGGTASTTGPLIKVTFNYNGPATFLVPPNCNNVVFSSVPEIAQNCRFREPYILKIVEEPAGSGVGRPGGDWIPVTAGYTSTINCNPLEIFDEDSLKAAGDVTITPMYTLFFEDPGTDYTGDCLPNEICVDPTKYNLFQGTMVANPVTLTQPQISNSKNVSIDIRPLSHRNIINIQSCGYVPVAIFSAPGFDTRKIKIETVKMGDAGVKTVVIGKKRIPLTLDLDVNRDGLKDKVVLFDIKALNLAKYTPPVCLTGETTDGISFIGCDSVTIVSQKSWNRLCGCEDED